MLREQEITQIPFIVFYSRIQVSGTPSPRDCKRMNEYGIKSTINHEVHEEHEEKTKSINALNLHVLHELHGYFFYIEYFHSLPSLARQIARQLKVEKPSWGSAFPGLCRFLRCGMFVISTSLITINRTQMTRIGRICAAF